MLNYSIVITLFGRHTRTHITGTHTHTCKELAREPAAALFHSLTHTHMLTKLKTSQVLLEPSNYF